MNKYELKTTEQVRLILIFCFSFSKKTEKQPSVAMQKDPKGNLEFSPEGLYVPPCSEIILFKDYLRDSRKMDDNLILTLNKTDGSPSQCQKIYNQWLDSHLFREKHIQKCLEENTNIKESSTPNSWKKDASFLQSQMGVEQILRDTARKHFKTKCPGFNTPT